MTSSDGNPDSTFPPAGRIDRFLRLDLDADSRRRARLIVLAALLISTARLPASLVGFLRQDLVGSVLFFAVFLAGVAVPFVLRSTGSIPLATHLLIASFVSGSAILNLGSDGYNQALLFLQAIVPVGAVLLAGRRVGAFWSLINLAILLSFSTREPVPPEFFGNAGPPIVAGILSLIMFGTAWIFDDTNQRAIDSVENINSRLERALAEAEEASRAKSDFLANMSHELRTPMNGVIGTLDLLTDSKMSRDQKDLVRTASSSAESLLGLLNDILDFSKIEAGKLEIDPHESDLEQLLNDIGTLLAVRAEDKGVELIFYAEGGVQQGVWVDSLRLRQILTNLIGNAIKFTEEGHVLVRVVVGQDGFTHRFEVSDTGVGIPSDRLDRLFEKFTQADSSTTRRYGGTGLGLAISKQLVELMGGRIGAESQLGEGSTFWFELPLEPAALPAQPVSIEDLRDLRLFFVDDNSTNRWVLGEQLASAGLRADGFSSGREALEAMRTRPASEAYDLGILDFQMPEMDGLTLARTITNDRLIRSPRLILLSSVSFGRGSTDSAEACREVGFDSVLQKPTHASGLFREIARVASLLGRRAPLEVAPDSSLAMEMPLAGTRVLLAEDNLVNQKVATRMLERLGCTVSVAADGQEAVDSYQSENYDLILMDCQMPVLGGLDATREIRRIESDGEGHIPIVALTAAALKGDREKCLEAGMDDFLTKPIRREALVESLARWAVQEAA